MALGAELMVVAGEASGDMHAADLVRALQAKRPELRFFGMGGERLGKAGVELLYGAHEVNVMGLTEVLPKIPRILRVLWGLGRAAKERRPAVAVLVDIPDFNLRLARKLKGLGIPVVYFISPMIWAWRRGRVKTIAKRVNRMLCILPFEEAFYREAGVKAVYVGSPVVEQVPAPNDAEKFRTTLGLSLERPTLALLPGSRLSEVTRLLPDMVRTAELMKVERPGLQVVVPVAPTVPREMILEAFASSSVRPILIAGRAPEVVGASDAALVASGTAVLEAGLMERPLVVVYRVSLITYWMGRLLLKVAHIALVNLLANRRLVPELLQKEFSAARAVEELQRMWSGRDRAEVVAGLHEVRRSLGPGGASSRAADEVLEVLDGAVL